MTISWHVHKQKAVALFLAAAILPTIIHADRAVSEQEEYYIKNFRNNPNRREFMFVRNNRSSNKNGRNAVDIHHDNPYGDQEDYSIPKGLLFVPLVGVWIAVLILIRHSSPQVITMLSMVCRRISEFTRNMSEKTAAMHERNQHRISDARMRAKYSSKRAERNIELSSSLSEIANLTSDEEFGSEGQPRFSSFSVAKTVVASNFHHHEPRKVLREPSPPRREGHHSKHNKHAPPRLRRGNDSGDRHHNRHSHHENSYNKQDRHGDERTKMHSHHGESHRQTEAEGSSSHRQTKSHLSSSSKLTADNLSRLEKKLSDGSHTRRHR